MRKVLNKSQVAQAEYKGLYGKLWLRYKSLYGNQEMTFVIQFVPCMGYLPNKYSQASNVIIFPHPGELKRDLSNFDIFAL